MAFTIALVSAANAVVGNKLRFTATRTGGTAWTNATSQSAPLTISGDSAAYVVWEVTTGGNSSDCVVYLGDNPGVRTLTDIDGNTQTISVLATRPAHAAGGTTWFVQGGIEDVPMPSISPGGGDTAMCFQVIAKNATGHTAGVLPTMATLNNVPVDDTTLLPTGPTDPVWAASTRVVMCLNYSENSGQNIIWQAIAGATSYDVYRAPDGVTWQTMATNVSATSLVDTGLTYTNASLPLTNTTATGSDSNNGLTSGTAFATMTKAASVATSGDTISPIGFVWDTSNVTIPDGVNISGRSVAGEFATLKSGFIAASDNHKSYRLGSRSTVTGIRCQTDAYATSLIGTGSADAPVVDCDLVNCELLGFTNAARFTVGNCSMTFTDVTMTSTHGTLGIISAGTIVNATRVKCVARGGVVENVPPISCQVTAGALCAWDMQFMASTDSQQDTSVGSTALKMSGTSTLRSLLLMNSDALSFGPDSTDFIGVIVGSNNLIDARLRNTRFNAAKSPSLNATVSSIGQRVSLGTVASASTSGGNFRSNQSAVTSGGIFGEART